ncbi:MAG: hypothetical protein EAZ57_03935 [Cytophagales bacterium]|nr:MAG: hypothetical protein EAZ67_04950 [Cytophagales bacterium]TAF61360.1 MAG: hypothetical protein EAZ57_03935 [Cytophagales bacterium]
MSYRLLSENKYASVQLDNIKNTLLLTTKSSFIPPKEFQDIFQELSKLVPTHKIKKLIFDKRSLTVFHQASMVWYHLIWKRDMAVFGLKKHIKILPNDIIFRKSVEIGRQKIQQEDIANVLSAITILYAEGLEEAENL